MNAFIAIATAPAFILPSMTSPAPPLSFMPPHLQRPAMPPALQV
jgi:hypothetical protein